MRAVSKPQPNRQAGALADFPILRDWIETWKNALTENEWTPWLIVGFAALLRFFLLGIKPPHFDEGINGWFVDQMVKNGYYRYDPTNYHGPLHFYVLLLSQTLFGRNVLALRLPVVLVSVSCVWLTLKFESFVSRPVTRLAALAMAVSPGFVFYGRYSIHEVWILFFTILLFYGAFGLWKYGSVNYLWCAGMGATGMILSKETYILHIGCAAIAIIACGISAYLIPFDEARPAKQTWNYVDLLVVIGTGIALIVFFYSGTFFHWNGIKGLYLAYKPWFDTGSQGHGHEKPWYYWLKLVAPSFEWGRADCYGYELPVLIGLLLCLASVQFKNIYLRYLAIYGVGTVMAYSIVKYKTPWCVISFVWPFLFIFGAAFLMAPLRYAARIYLPIVLVLSAALGWAIGYRWIWNNTNYLWVFSYIIGVAIILMVLRYFIATQLLLVVALVASLGSSIWLNYFHCTTDTEPYVYVQTYNDIYKLTDPLLMLAKHNPLAYQLTGHIIRASPYPLPWILGDFAHVGYYEKEDLPNPVDGDFLLVQEEKIPKVEAKLQGVYYTVPLTIRPYQDPSKAYFSAKYFKGFFPDRAPDFSGPIPAPTPSATPTPQP